MEAPHFGQLEPAPLLVAKYESCDTVCGGLQVLGLSLQDRGSPSSSPPTSLAEHPRVLMNLGLMQSTAVLMPISSGVCRVDGDDMMKWVQDAFIPATGKERYRPFRAGSYLPSRRVTATGKYQWCEDSPLTRLDMFALMINRLYCVFYRDLVSATCLLGFRIILLMTSIRVMASIGFGAIGRQWAIALNNVLATVKVSTVIAVMLIGMNINFNRPSDKGDIADRWGHHSVLGTSSSILSVLMITALFFDSGVELFSTLPANMPDNGRNVSSTTILESSFTIRGNELVQWRSDTPAAFDISKWRNTSICGDSCFPFPSYQSLSLVEGTANVIDWRDATNLDQLGHLVRETFLALYSLDTREKRAESNYLHKYPHSTPDAAKLSFITRPPQFRSNIASISSQRLHRVPLLVHSRALKWRERFAGLRPKACAYVPSCPL